MEPKYIPADRLNAYQRGQLDNAETIKLVQDLLDDGILWMGQGILGELAAEYAEGGYITIPVHDCEDNIIHGEIETYCKVCGPIPR